MTVAPSPQSKTEAAPINGALADIDGFTHHFAAVDGTRIHYVSGGAGPAVVLYDGKVNRAAFAEKLTMPVLVLNGERGIPQEQTRGSVEQVFANVEHDKVPLAGHAFAADRPDWTADRIISFLDPMNGKPGEERA